jgi:CheY-like chemotaxis protein
MKLLIVEDNPSVRRILKMVTASVADEILECEDGNESVVVYRAERPDFVLMDINLGESNGILATQHIKEFDKHAKIIIVTNYDEPDLRQAAAEAGAIDFVVKEDLSLLISILKNN